MLLAPAKTWAFPSSVGRYTLVGRSRAADGTALVVPELSFGLDAGALVHPARPHYLFITHTHSDHSHYLTHYKSRRVRPTIFCPKRAAPFIESYLLHAQEMTDMTIYDNPSEQLEPAYDLMPVEPGEFHPLQRGGLNYAVRVVKCTHKIDCVGYCFYEKRKRLREDLKGRPGKELAELRKSGQSIDEEYHRPLFAFMGDTTHQVFEDYGNYLFEMPVIIVECTFALDDELENAVRTQHMHWKDLRPIVDSHPDITFVLIHFSLRYTADELKQAIDTNVHKNVVLWLSPSDEEWTAGNAHGHHGSKKHECGEEAEAEKWETASEGDERRKK